jgi:hypothetical protein
MAHWGLLWRSRPIINPRWADLKSVRGPCQPKGSYDRLLPSFTITLQVQTMTVRIGLCRRVPK